jgi:hypothetical protein
MVLILLRIFAIIQTWYDLNLEHDIWVAADFLIKRYGEYAEIIAGERHEQVEILGDVNESLVWKKIPMAIREMVTEIVPKDTTLH